MAEGAGAGSQDALSDMSELKAAVVEASGPKSEPKEEEAID
jgi:hypothetical protein